MKKLLALLTIFLFADYAAAQNVNKRPTNETSYSVVAGDAGTLVVARNSTASETFSLAGLSCPFQFKAKNNGTFPLYVSGVPGGGNIVTGLGIAPNIVLSQGASAELICDTPDWQAQLYVNGVSNDNGNDVVALGHGQLTLAYLVKLDGTCTNGQVVGFDYTFNGGAPVQIRHTLASGATCFLDAVNAWEAQFRANAAIRAALMPSIFTNGAVSHNQSGSSYTFFWNQFYPFVTTANPSVTAVPGTGSATVVVSGGGPVMENASGKVCGRSTLSFGRAPMAGDILCLDLVLGDSGGKMPDPITYMPYYGVTSYRIVDPNSNPPKGAIGLEWDTVNIGPESVRLNGSWLTFTPILTCQNGGTMTATATGLYKRIDADKTVAVQMTINVSNRGTCPPPGTASQHIFATLPFPAEATGEYFVGGIETMVTGKQLNGYVGSGPPSRSILSIGYYDNTFPGANGSKLVINGTYQRQ